MKRKLTMLATLTAGAVLLIAADVKTDYSHSADFSRYHSYSWLKVQAGNSLWADRIQRDVNNELTAKGWTEAPSGGDASVAAIGAVQERESLNTFYDGIGGGWFWGGFGNEAITTPQYTPVGSLTVDIFDSTTKKLIWRGTADNTLSGNAEKNEKKLADTVKDMFKHFPPEGRG